MRTTTSGLPAFRRVSSNASCCPGRRRIALLRDSPLIKAFSPTTAMMTSLCFAPSKADENSSLEGAKKSQPCTYCSETLLPSLFFIPSNTVTTSASSPLAFQEPITSERLFASGPMSAIRFVCLERGSVALSFFNRTVEETAAFRAKSIID